MRGLLRFVAITCTGLGITTCAPGSSDDLDGGGLNPPPGFVERVDANCRAASDVSLSAEAPIIRQLNGQSLLTYTLSDGRTAQCAVRHADESVIDMRVMGAD